MALELHGNIVAMCEPIDAFNRIMTAFKSGTVCYSGSEFGWQWHKTEDFYTRCYRYSITYKMPNGDVLAIGEVDNKYHGRAEQLLSQSIISGDLGRAKTEFKAIISPTHVRSLNKCSILGFLVSVGSVPLAFLMALDAKKVKMECGEYQVELPEDVFKKWKMITIKPGRPEIIFKPRAIGGNVQDILMDSYNQQFTDTLEKLTPPIDMPLKEPSRIRTGTEFLDKKYKLFKSKKTGNGLLITQPEPIEKVVERTPVTTEYKHFTVTDPKIDKLTYEKYAKIVNEQFRKNLSNQLLKSTTAVKESAKSAAFTMKEMKAVMEKIGKRAGNTNPKFDEYARNKDLFEPTETPPETPATSRNRQSIAIGSKAIVRERLRKKAIAQ